MRSPPGAPGLGGALIRPRLTCGELGNGLLCYEATLSILQLLILLYCRSFVAVSVYSSYADTAVLAVSYMEYTCVEHGSFVEHGSCVEHGSL